MDINHPEEGNAEDAHHSELGRSVTRSLGRRFFHFSLGGWCDVEQYNGVAALIFKK